MSVDLLSTTVFFGVSFLGLLLSVVMMFLCEKAKSKCCIFWFIGIPYSLLVIMYHLPNFVGNVVPITAHSYLGFLPHLIGIIVSFSVYKEYLKKIVEFIGRMST